MWVYYTRALHSFEQAFDALRPLLLLDEAIREHRPFAGLTAGELEEAFKDMRDELDLEVSLALVASVEAVLRLDFQERMSRSDQDPAPLVARMRERWRRWQEETSFDEILDAWKEFCGDGNLIGKFKETLNLRHWIAHGRYWNPSGFRGLDPPNVIRRIDALNKIQSMPQLLPPGFL